MATWTTSDDCYPVTYLQQLYNQVCKFKHKYFNTDDILKDIMSCNRDYVAGQRLIYWAYPALKRISDHPIYSDIPKEVKCMYEYNSFEDKNEVEEKIIVAFCRVLHEIRQNPEKMKDMTVTYAYNHIARCVRNKTTSNIYKTLGIPLHKGQKNPKVKVLLMPDKLNNIATIDNTEKIINKDTANFIKKKIREFLKDKTRNEKIVFNMRLQKTSQYDGYEFCNIQTQQDIASTIGKTRRVVQRIKGHIMEEFREYWNAEIKPYI